MFSSLFFKMLTASQSVCNFSRTSDSSKTSGMFPRSCRDWQNRIVQVGWAKSEENNLESWIYCLLFSLWVFLVGLLDLVGGGPWTLIDEAYSLVSLKGRPGCSRPYQPFVPCPQAHGDYAKYHSCKLGKLLFQDRRPSLDKLSHPWHKHQLSLAFAEIDKPWKWNSVLEGILHFLRNWYDGGGNFPFSRVNLRLFLLEDQIQSTHPDPCTFPH